MSHGSYRIFGEEVKDFSRSKIIFSRTSFAVILYRMTPSLYTCCFVCAFCLWCVISTCFVNRSHHLHKVFLLSALSELTQTLYRESSSHFLLYRHRPFCPFHCVVIIIPIQNNIENIHTSVPREILQTLQMHRWRGIRLLLYLPPGRLGY